VFFSTYLGALCVTVPLWIGFAEAEPLKLNDESAHYCAAVYINGIVKSQKWLTIEKDVLAKKIIPGQLARDVDLHNADIERMKENLVAASRYFENRGDLTKLDRLANNPGYFRGELDIKACDDARKSANVKECLTKCMNTKLGGQCMDTCWEASSEPCKRTMSCAMFTTSAPEWTVYSPEGSGFRIAFPGQPEINEKMRLAVVKQGQSFFSVSFVDIPLGMPSSLDVARKGALEIISDNHVRALLRTERDVKVSGLPAKEFVIDFPATNNVRLSRHVLSGVRIISAGYLGPRGSEDSQQAKRFMDSLEILSK
jgi:hypothetical protein